MRLTDVVVRNLKPPPKGQRRVRDDLLSGFGVIVGQKRKTFFLMYGKNRQIKTFGHYPEKTLSDARNEAKRYLIRLDRKTAPTSILGLSELFLQDAETRLRPKSVSAYRTVLKHAPNIPIEKADKTTIKVETAHEIKAYKAMFNWAIREELTDRNPFFHLTPVYGKRERVLSYEELRTLWSYEHPPYSDIVKLLILTGQRVGQIGSFNMGWYKDRVITFPAEIMKQGRVHQIPTTPLIRKYLQDFNWKGWSKAKTRMEKKTEVKDHTLHDIRRTFATIHAQIGTPIHVIEALLDHSSGTISGVTAIYIRHKFQREMRQALLLYHRHLKKMVMLGH